MHGLRARTTVDAIEHATSVDRTLVRPGIHLVVGVTGEVHDGAEPCLTLADDEGEVVAPPHAHVSAGAVTQSGAGRPSGREYRRCEHYRNCSSLQRGTHNLPPDNDGDVARLRDPSLACQQRQGSQWNPAEWCKTDPSERALPQ